MKNAKYPTRITKTVKCLDGYVPLCENTVMHNKHLIFTADIDGTFPGMLTLGHGKTKYSSSYVEITEKTIAVRHHYAEPREICVVEHGLDIRDFISVNIDTEFGNADITVYTSTGKYKLVVRQKRRSIYGDGGRRPFKC